MFTVEKKLHQRSPANEFRSPIGFVVTPASAGEPVNVELTSIFPELSVIRVMDENGESLLQETVPFDARHTRLEYIMGNLSEGRYYFEVSDGFFYQIKEVRIPTA
ncbi:MAG: hypothetical protein SF053_03775 [Bacteroidia bacterium]|nr:hypothetical protein [Bacteroidia bacterium]